MSPAELPLAGLRFTLVGPGSVGQSLAAWIVARGGRLSQLAGRPGSASVQAFARRSGVPGVETRQLATRGEELLLIAVPDGEHHGFSVRSTEIVFRGLCSGCRTSAPDNPSTAATHN